MTEFFVSEELAAERAEQLADCGEFLGLDASFVETDFFQPGGRSEFTRYLSEFGIDFFSVDEVVKPHRPEKARQAGFTELLPPLHLWPWALLVLAVGDAMRREVEQPIRLRNVYRPMSYNKLVAKSGLRSDHPNACSGDFDFRTQSARRSAEHLLRQFHQDKPELEMSLGMGAKTLHVGIMSPKGSRHWFYDSYKDRREPL